MRTIHTQRVISLLALGAAWAATSCGGSDDDGRGQDPVSEQSSALMRRATSCEDLTQALQQDMRARLQQYVEQESYYYRGAVVGGVGISVAESGTVAIDGGAPVPAMATGGTTSAGPTLSVDGDEEGSAQAGPTDFTQTNTQVEGIDEADFVKTDGQRIYVLSGNTLTMSNAWPAEQLAVSDTVDVEGSPSEMYVVGDRDAAERQVVVYSTVDGASLYAEAGLEPPQGDGEDYIAEPPPSIDGSYVYYSLPATKVTVLSATADALEVVHEVYYEGSYVSSRRNSSRIRTVLQMPSPATGLQLYPSDADQRKAELLVVEQLLREGRSVADVDSDELSEMVNERLGEVVVAENEEAIAAMTYEDWLPHVFTRADSGLKATIMACEDFYIPAAGTSEQGLTHIAQLNLDDLGALDGRAVLGVATEMYENDSAMVLASSTWDWPEEAATAESDEYVGPELVTYLHRFDVSEPGQLDYIASGIVDGGIYGQFALDEADGFLRVVTTEDNWSTGSVNHLFVLEADGTDLELVGDAGPLAPGEQVYAARFVGDTGYIVTYRQIDPLFVIDLSTPTDPVVLAELKIPGFSEYMHPMDDDHLLTVGRDGDEETGWTQNVALQVFDVTDRTDPVLMHKYVFEQSGSTEASVTHKAVTYFAAKGLLALPFLSEQYTTDGYYRGQSSTMELFSVSLEDGIVSIGAVDGDLLDSNAERIDSGYYCYGTGGLLSRGIFFDDVLFAVASNGIIAAPVTDPATPISSVRFKSADVVPEYCYVYDERAVAAGGSTGEPATGGTGNVDDKPPAADSGSAGSSADGSDIGTGGTGSS
jgi:hypothetical protein